MCKDFDNYINKINLTPKQISFCQEYLKDFNGTQAAIRAGYSKKTANEQASRLLANVNISNYLKNFSSIIEKNNIMDIQEIQERLTKMARGETDEEVIIITGSGDGYSDAHIMTKKVSARDQVKALELLGKANSLFVDKIQNLSPPKIYDDIPDEEIDEG